VAVAGLFRAFRCRGVAEAVTKPPVMIEEPLVLPPVDRDHRHGMPPYPPAISPRMRLVSEVSTYFETGTSAGRIGFKWFTASRPMVLAIPVKTRIASGVLALHPAALSWPTA